MSVMMKVLFAVALVGVPAVAALRVDGMPARAAEPRIHAGASVQMKDEARIASPDIDVSGLLAELAQASRPPEQSPMRMAQGFAPGRPPHGPGAEGPFEGPPPPFMGPPMPPFMGPPMPPQPIRAACENRVNAEAALAGYLTSKLRLTNDQLQLWKKVEDAAQPAFAKLHAACDRLPVGPAAAPNLPDALDTVEAEISARLDLIRATRDPLRALYQTLTPEQRAALLPPMRHP